ncbi:MAG: hypothetical protein HC927_13585 [Deltaproteobacteria bacterium]|nr:hypothetical protein [Deltaproteobacteria bacterium]
MGVLILDLLLVAVVMLSAGRPARELDVVFQSGFPASMIILHNRDGDRLEDLEITIDGGYTARLEELEPNQSVGLELVREFRDPNGAFPPANLRPTKAVVRRGTRTETYDVLIP